MWSVTFQMSAKWPVGFLLLTGYLLLLEILLTLFHLFLIGALYGSCYIYIHFINEEMEV